jgi:hypothetical protein
VISATLQDRQRSLLSGTPVVLFCPSYLDGVGLPTAALMRELCYR